MYLFRLVVGSCVSVGGGVTVDSVVSSRGGVVTGANRLMAVIAGVRRCDG